MGVDSALPKLDAIHHGQQNPNCSSQALCKEKGKIQFIKANKEMQERGRRKWMVRRQV